MAKFDIRSALAFGFKSLFKHFGLMFAVVLTWVAVTLVTAALKFWILGGTLEFGDIRFLDPFHYGSATHTYARILSGGFPVFDVVRRIGNLFGLDLIFGILKLGLTAGFIKIGLNIYDGKTASYETLWHGFKILPKIFVAEALYGLILIGGTLIGVLPTVYLNLKDLTRYTIVDLGIVLLFIPVIYLGIRYVFYLYSIVDKNAGIIDAFTNSSRLTDGAMCHLFCYGIIMTLLLSLGYATILGSLIFWPAVSLATVAVYRSLQGRKPTLKKRVARKA